MVFKGASESDGQNNEQGSLYFISLLACEYFNARLLRSEAVKVLKLS